MTNEEVEVVAEELARSGGLSWCPGRAQGSLMQVVTSHYREQARVVIAALDHLRTGGGDTSQVPDAQRVGPPDALHRDPVSDVRPGATIIYRPSGDQRASPSRIVEIQGDRTYLAPIVRTCVGWVSLERLEPSTEEPASDS
jgi:hypothetical protein